MNAKDFFREKWERKVHFQPDQKVAYTLRKGDYPTHRALFRPMVEHRFGYVKDCLGSTVVVVDDVTAEHHLIDRRHVNRAYAFALGHKVEVIDKNSKYIGESGLVCALLSTPAYANDYCVEIEGHRQYFKESQLKHYETPTRDGIIGAFGNDRPTLLRLEKEGLIEIKV